MLVQLVIPCLFVFPTPSISVCVPIDMKHYYFLTNIDAFIPPTFLRVDPVSHNGDVKPGRTAHRYYGGVFSIKCVCVCVHVLMCEFMRFHVCEMYEQDTKKRKKKAW